MDDTSLLSSPSAAAAAAAHHPTARSAANRPKSWQSDTYVFVIWRRVTGRPMVRGKQRRCRYIRKRRSGFQM